jgi:ribosomal protein S7
MKKIKNIKKFNQFKWHREIIYESWWLSKFINKFIVSGKKTLAEKHVYTAFATINNLFGQHTPQGPVTILYDALERLKPIMDCTFIRKGKQTNRNKVAEKEERLNPYATRTKKEKVLYKTKGAGKKKRRKKKKKKKKLHRLRAVPFPIQPRRQYVLALHWWSNAIKRREEQTLANRIFFEFTDFLVYNKTTALRDFNNLVYLVIKNRSYSNFRWI